MTINSPVNIRHSTCVVLNRPISIKFIFNDLLVWFVTTSNTLQYCFNYKYILFYSFLVITIVLYSKGVGFTPFRSLQLILHLVYYSSKAVGFTPFRFFQLILHLVYYSSKGVRFTPFRFFQLIHHLVYYSSKGVGFTPILSTSYLSFTYYSIKIKD